MKRREERLHDGSGRQWWAVSREAGGRGEFSAEARAVAGKARVAEVRLVPVTVERGPHRRDSRSGSPASDCGCRWALSPAIARLVAVLGEARAC